MPRAHLNLFLAGIARARFGKTDKVMGYFPRREELTGVEFPSRKRSATAPRGERAREEAKDAMMAAYFREQAREAP